MENKIYKELLQIAEDRNIEVIDYMLKQQKMKGLYIQNGDIEIIFLNVSLQDDPVERNFILAHELGHAKLHKGKIDEELYFNDKNYCSRLEDEANNYAASLIKKIKEIQEISKTLKSNPDILNLIKISRTDPKLIKKATRQLKTLKIAR